MKKISMFMMSKRLLCGMLFLQFLGLSAHKDEVSVSHLKSASLGAGVCAVVLSGAQGLYNVRKYHQILSQCQLNYGLSSPVYLLEYPLQICQNLICSGLPDLDMTYQKKHGLAGVEIAKKIAVFDGVHPETIWDFEKFRNIMPHTNFKEAYCISKNYLGCFGYPTLGMLKDAVVYQIESIEQDFKKLTHLTDLSWSFAQMPATLLELKVLEGQLVKLSDYYGAYTFLGAFGYSPIHNGQRVKNYLVALAKMHAFLLNLQELLATCIDNEETQLIQSQGYLQFSLQHVHYIEQRNS